MLRITPGDKVIGEFSANKFDESELVLAMGFPNFLIRGIGEFLPDMAFIAAVYEIGADMVVEEISKRLAYP